MLSHSLISTAVFPTDAFSEVSGDAGATAVFDVFDCVLEFDAGELVFVVFAGAPQAIAKAVMQVMNSTFLMRELSPFDWFEIANRDFSAFPGARHFTSLVAKELFTHARRRLWGQAELCRRAEISGQDACVPKLELERLL